MNLILTTPNLIGADFMRVVVGVDPGIRGGFAIVVVNPGNTAELLDAIDIPIVGIGAKERERARSARLDPGASAATCLH